MLLGGKKQYSSSNHEEMSAKCETNSQIVTSTGLQLSPRVRFVPALILEKRPSRTVEEIPIWASRSAKGRSMSKHCKRTSGLRMQFHNSYMMPALLSIQAVTALPSRHV